MMYNPENKSDSSNDDIKIIEKELQENNLDSAEKHIYENLKSNSSDLYLKYLQSQLFYKKNESFKSVSILEDILYEDPDSILARNDLGVLYFRNGEVAKAIECLNFAIENNSYNYNIIRNLADMLRESERFEESLRFYARILQEFPEDKEVLQIMGYLSLEAGHHKDAKKYSEAILKIDNNDHEAQNILKILNEFENKT
jgi:tetratricopeptide (TPR) repeat protein